MTEKPKNLADVLPLRDLKTHTERKLTLVFSGLEGKDYAFDRRKLGQRVLEASKIFGDEPVALRPPDRSDELPDPAA